MTGSTKTWFHIIDSSCRSTVGARPGGRRLKGDSAYNFAMTAPTGDMNYAGGEYWISYDSCVASSITPRYAFIPSSHNTSNDPSETIYWEQSTYKVVKQFNWHTGPSVNTDTNGSASVGETFITDAVIWNKKTNNMWVKKAGENKYVFAGYKWNGSKWYLDNSQTQYLQFVSDSAEVKWPDCNVGLNYVLESPLARSFRATVTAK